MATLTPTLTPSKAQPQAGGSGPHDGSRSGRGGGDGDGASYGDRLRRYRIGMVMALIPVLMLFVALTSAYIVRQGVGQWNELASMYLPDWQPVRLPYVLLWINTLILVASSFTIELARRRFAYQAEMGSLGLRDEAPPVPWLGITLVLGLGFVVGQLAVWRILTGQGVYLSSNPASSFFYVLTGAHAAHLTGGILALLYAALAALVAKSLARKRMVTDVTALYWHFMALLWIYIFALLHYAN